MVVVVVATIFVFVASSFTVKNDIYIYIQFKYYTDISWM